MKKDIIISADKLKKAMPKPRKPFAQRTKVVPSKKIYHRQNNTDDLST
jgi:hypothetical protein